MSNIQKPNHNKHINRQQAYDNLMECITELALSVNILKDRNADLNKQYSKANIKRRERIDAAIEYNSSIIISTNEHIKKLLKEKHTLEARGCK